MLFLTNIAYVLLEIRAIEKVRVSRVDDLEQQVRLLDDAPKLLPDLDILLEWSNGQLYIVFLHACDIAAPL